MNYRITIDFDSVVNQAGPAFNMALQALELSGAKIARSCINPLEEEPEGSPMDLHLLLGKFPDGSLEALVCWDSACVEGNGEGFEEACQTARDKTDCTDFRKAVISTTGLPELFKISKFQGTVVSKL